MSVDLKRRKGAGHGLELLGVRSKGAGFRGGRATVGRLPAVRVVDWPVFRVADMPERSRVKSLMIPGGQGKLQRTSRVADPKGTRYI
jgi:hypothetical protein